MLPPHCEPSGETNQKSKTQNSPNRPAPPRPTPKPGPVPNPRDPRRTNGENTPPCSWQKSRPAMPRQTHYLSTRNRITPHPHHPPHKSRNVRYPTRHRKLNNPLTRPPRPTPTRIRIRLDRRKSALAPILRKRPCRPAINRTQRNRRAISIHNRRGIQFNNVLLKPPIRSRRQQPTQPCPAHPHKNPRVQKPIPILRTKPVLKTAPQPHIIHRLLITHHRAPKPRSLDNNALRPLPRLDAPPGGLPSPQKDRARQTC